jgi:sn-glycerol 3-phosphate transport system ATP-binding protein
MATVELTDIKKIYAGGVEAVRGVSLTVPNGSFTVLLGPSGCGKSTLLRMIAGLETITSGVCKIGDRVVNEIEPAARDIAMVFQNYALYPHMSVYDNMAYGLRNRGTPKPEIDKRVREAAKLLAIEEYLTRKPRALSGGQRQRVAMGRAIVREPQVFLFDEPLSNLDAKLRVTMRLEIKRLHNRLNATSIFVTHDQVEAMTLADQVVVMNAGNIEQIGAPGEVYKHPASRFVASFIGSPGDEFNAGESERFRCCRNAGRQAAVRCEALFGLGRSRCRRQAGRYSCLERVERIFLHARTRRGTRRHAAPARKFWRDPHHRCDPGLRHHPRK